MTIALWIINVILALVFLGAGGMHAFQPQEKLVASGMGWAADNSPAFIKAIGWLEILGAIGLIVPMATDIAPILTPLAAIGLAVVMSGAVVTHARRKESVTTEAILVALAIASAVIGFIAL